MRGLDLTLLKFVIWFERIKLKDCRFLTKMEDNNFQVPSGLNQ